MINSEASIMTKLNKCSYCTGLGKRVGKEVGRWYSSCLIAKGSFNWCPRERHSTFANFPLCTRDEELCAHWEWEMLILTKNKKRVWRSSINVCICSLRYTQQRFYLQCLFETIARNPPTCFLIISNPHRTDKLLRLTKMAYFLHVSAWKRFHEIQGSV